MPILGRCAEPPAGLSRGNLRMGELARMIYPELAWLDPLRYQPVNPKEALPFEHPIELAVGRQAQTELSSQKSRTAFLLLKQGDGKLWKALGEQLARESGAPKGPAALALLEEVLITEHRLVKERKAVLNEPRPFLVDPRIRAVGEQPAGTSNPSNHAGASYAAATVLAHFYPQRAQELYAIAANVARSRVYMGHHFAGDVAAGARLGVNVALEALARFDGGAR